MATSHHLKVWDRDIMAVRSIMALRGRHDLHTYT
jgi:hypothetical protein